MYQFIINHKPVSFSGTIAFVSADNLGAQLIGGFKESASALLKCRHCMGTTTEITCSVSLFCAYDHIIIILVSNSKILSQH